MYFENEDAPGSKGYTAIKELVDQMAKQHGELVELIRREKSK
jgi:hypothetical protein